MSSWADASEDDLQPAPSSYTGERPRLQLKPRSAAAQDATSSSGGGGSSSKSNPFGAAKPRELVLQSKGIDPSLVEKRIERKASIPRLTGEWQCAEGRGRLIGVLGHQTDQNRQVENLRTELTTLEEQLREANENELPEEEYRSAAEEKRKELNDLMKEFTELNMNGGGGGDADAVEERGDGKKKEEGGGGERKTFERPSERRRRLEAKRREEGGGHGGGHGRRYHDDEEGGGEDPYGEIGLRCTSGFY
eukprot:scaffold1495_cov186-Alexandrium_tamarense.AAC.13